MLDVLISDEENLYRGILKIWWDEEKKRPSSAAFKDSNGNSCNRDGGRLEGECVNQLLEQKTSDGGSFDFKAIVKLSARSCREYDTFPKYDKLAENIYHSLIQDTEFSIVIKSSSKARKLSRNCHVVFERPDNPVIKNQ